MNYTNRNIGYANWVTSANTVGTSTTEITEAFHRALDEFRRGNITGFDLAYEPDITIETKYLTCEPWYYRNPYVVQQYPITILEDMWDGVWIGSVEEKEKEPADEHELDEFLDSIVKKGVDSV